MDITKSDTFVQHNIDYERIVTQYTWQGIFHHIAYQSFGTVAVLCWGFTPIADLIAGRSRRLPMEGWYPYNTTATPAFEIISVHQAVAIFVACFHNVAMDTLVTGLITVACCQLSILSQTIASVQNNEEKDERNVINNVATKNEYDVPYEILKKCVKHGNVIFRYVVLSKETKLNLLTNIKYIFSCSFINEIQNIFGTMILLQFSVNCIIICLIAFNISQVYFDLSEYHLSILSKKKIDIIFLIIDESLYSGGSFRYAHVYVLYDVPNFYILLAW